MRSTRYRKAGFEVLDDQSRGLLSAEASRQRFGCVVGLIADRRIGVFLETKRLTTSECPRHAATCSDVLPFGVRGPFGSAPARNSAFLPSFVVILAGGPVVEATHGRIALTAPLTAITAAVVGVIVHLALFFGGHVLWPHGFEAAPDPVAGLASLTPGTPR